jgi:ABC-2 type transport system permease protein
LAFAVIIGIPLSMSQLMLLIPASLIVCFFGGAFGVIIMANLKSQRAANQVFPFIMLPQYFLAGVFTPINELPWYLDILSLISPMRYAVDLLRGGYYLGLAEYSAVVLESPAFNLGISVVLFALFLVVGTILFVRREKNR